MAGMRKAGIFARNLTHFSLWSPPSKRLRVRIYGMWSRSNESLEAVSICEYNAIIFAVQKKCSLYMYQGLIPKKKSGLGKTALLGMKG